MVVTFLSMLGQEAEQGGVHRMLGICAEFERIAKAVIEKAEKDQSSRRKRKNQDTTRSSPNPTTKTTPVPGSSNQTPRQSTGAEATPPMSGSSIGDRRSSQAQLSPPQNGDHRSSFSMNTPMNDPSPAGSAGWPQEFPVPQPGQNGDFDSFMNGNGSMQSPPGPPAGGFQQPLLPQDLFSLPMNLDWSWAEMTTGAYPTVENGNFGEEGQVSQQ